MFSTLDTVTMTPASIARMPLARPIRATVATGRVAIRLAAHSFDHGGIALIEELEGAEQVRFVQSCVTAPRHEYYTLDGQLEHSVTLAAIDFAEGTR